MNLSPHSSDDEESLQLKMDLLKAKLALKKRKVPCTSLDSAVRLSQSKSVERPTTPPPKPSPLAQASPIRSPSVLYGTQVPKSPSPRKPALPVSPARILLGIDKGRTGRDVKLTRSPIKSFNQRLQEGRAVEAEKRVKATDLAKVRRTIFNPVPPFRVAEQSGSIQEKDPITGLSIHDRKVATEDVREMLGDLNLKTAWGVTQLHGKIDPSTHNLSEDVLNYVIWGIVARKSGARDTRVKCQSLDQDESGHVHANGLSDRERSSKYVTITLVDFKTEIQLFLYDQAFSNFWTLPLGSAIMLLNPSILPPRQIQPGSQTRGQRNSISLRVSEKDGIMEIGKSSEFAFCRSIKRNGEQCQNYVNSSKSEVCDFHIDIGLKKSSNKRMEFAGGVRLFDPTSKRQKTVMTDSDGGMVYINGAGLSDVFDQPPPVDQGRIQREAEKREKEREMLARLMEKSSQGVGHEYFETSVPSLVGLGTTNMENYSNDVNGHSTQVQDERSVFNPVVLRKLGFDPTRRPEMGQGSVHNRTLGSPRRSSSVNLDVQTGENVRAVKNLSKVFCTIANNEELGTEDQHKNPSANESDSDLEILF